MATSKPYSRGLVPSLTQSLPDFINTELLKVEQAFDAVEVEIGALGSHTHVAADITDFSEAVDDRVSALFVAGTNVTLTYNDVANTLTIDATGGGGGTTTNALTFNNGGAGAASGATFNGSAAVTISYNTVGAAPASHTHAESDITGLTADLAGKQPLDATLTALAAVNWSAGTQVLTLTAADTFTLKTVGASAGNILDKASGDSLYQPLDATLTSLAAYNTNGILTQTAADTFAGRTITAGAGITVTNGNGVSGNPTIAKASYRGALVTKAANQTGANYSAGVNIAWDSEAYDTDSIHDNATNNTRLTVPSGVTKVRLSFNLLLSNVTANTVVQIDLLKNGTSGYVGDPACGDSSASTSPRFGETSPVLSVTSGDYFELNLGCGDTSIDVAANYSWFAMEIIE